MNEKYNAGRIISIGFIILVVFFMMDWIIAGDNFLLYKFFAPRQEAVRRQVVEQSKSYRQGSKQRLGTLCTQVQDADDSHKGLINDIIKQEFVEWDAFDVPVHLRSCLATARAH